jgi:acyl carrier protein
MANANAGSGHFQGSYRSLSNSWTQTYIIQLNAESHFHNDLGLDSLDTVEVVMAIEEVSRN